MEDLKRLILPVALSLLVHGLVLSYKLPEQQRLKPALDGSPIKIRMNTFSPKPVVEKKVEPKMVVDEPVKAVKEVVKPKVVIASYQKKVVIKPEPPPKVEQQSLFQREDVNISSESENNLAEKEVDVAPIQKKAVPIYRQNKQPPYPVIAKRRGYQGEVLLHVLVDKKGAVAELQVKKSSGHVSLDRMALKSVKYWLFTPATEGGGAVTMWVDVPISFELK